MTPVGEVRPGQGSDRQRWQVVAPFGLHWLTTEGEAIVYCDGSGDTHLLGAFAAEILRRIEDAPVSAAELAGEAVASTGEPEIQVRSAVAEALREFHRLGLIEPSRL